MHDVVMLGKVLQDPIRVRILACLQQGEVSKPEFLSIFSEINRRRLETHLDVLRRAGMISTSREGHWLSFRISDQYQPIVAAIFRAFRTTINWDPDVTRDRQRMAQRPNGRKPVEDNGDNEISTQQALNSDIT
jgi:DNA-binding transcriptional ArsR family regulator